MGLFGVNLARIALQQFLSFGLNLRVDLSFGVPGLAPGLGYAKKGLDLLERPKRVHPPKDEQRTLHKEAGETLFLMEYRMSDQAASVSARELEG